MHISIFAEATDGISLVIQVDSALADPSIRPDQQRVRLRGVAHISSISIRWRPAPGMPIKQTFDLLLHAMTSVRVQQRDSPDAVTSKVLDKFGMDVETPVVPKIVSKA